MLPVPPFVPQKQHLAGFLFPIVLAGNSFVLTKNKFYEKVWISINEFSDSSFCLCSACLRKREGPAGQGLAGINHIIIKC